jgi:hypothetical protein
MIKTIEIKKIKGIESTKFELNIIPNKPSLLVAPNGFGKSSMAIGFNSMNNNKIKLADENCYENNVKNLPEIHIEYRKPDGAVCNLVATNNTNSIKDEFDWFVVNSRLKPKGIGSQYGTATARLEIAEVVVVDNIPDNISFKDLYPLQVFKTRFGINHKILPNLQNSIFQKQTLINKISEHYEDLERANGQRIKQSIDNIITQINTQSGNEQQLKSWITENCLKDLQAINYLNNIAMTLNETINDEIKSYLAAIQFIWLYNKDKDNFKKACEYNNYKLEKQRLDGQIKSFNSTWKDLKTTEIKGKLVVKFPKATDISNGERDILTFISMLFRARQRLKKKANILIIDEIFDYLDDANLIAAQYYITQFITEYKESGKDLYPLILTHLNPLYFKNYAFKDQKVYYLDKSAKKVDENLIKLLRNRDNSTIKDDVSKYLLHYNSDKINKRSEFKVLQLKETWGEGDNFANFVNEHKDDYLNGNPYDPFAVCCALRLKVEELAYNQLDSEGKRTKFIETHKTREKLDCAGKFGAKVPETHYLLGIIYNEAMHWKENQDNVSPVASKLENLVIQNMIKEVFK